MPPLDDVSVDAEFDVSVGVLDEAVAILFDVGDVEEVAALSENRWSFRYNAISALGFIKVSFWPFFKVTPLTVDGFDPS